MSEENEINLVKSIENLKGIKKKENNSPYHDVSTTSQENLSEKEKDEEEISIRKNRNCKLAKSISEILDKLTLRPIKNFKKKILKDSFTGKRFPNITIYDYINRIITYTEIEENTLICSLIYIDKLDQKKQVTKFNIHRIFFSAVLCSIKYNEDEFFKNDYYSQVAGVTLNELNKMEYDFLVLLDFNLYIEPNTFNDYKMLLNNKID